MLKNYLKITLRNIFKHKGYSFINVTGLAVGIACCMLIFLWIQDELSYDRFHEKGDDLYRIVTHTPMGMIAATPYALPSLLKRTYPEITGATRFYPIEYAAKYEDKIFFEEGALVDEDFFEMFTFPFVNGSPQNVFPEKNTIVISETLARKYFGDDDPIGKILTVDNTMNLAVTGVIKDVPKNSHMQFGFLAPILNLEEELLQSWAKESSGYVLLQSRASVDGIRKKIADSIMKNDVRNKIETVVDLQPLRKIHLYALQGTNPIVYIYIFAAIALIILLIACINFVNLSTARTAYRSKEIGIRKVLGAKRIDIARQFFGEAIIMTFFAMLIAILLVLIILPSFNTLAAKQLSLDITGNIWNVFALLLITIITGILASSYTSLFMSSFQPVKVLKTHYSPGSKNYILRRVLVVVQFSLAVILIICTAVIYKQLNYIQDKDLGFEKDNIISIDMNPQIKKNFDVIKTEALRNPEILNVTSATSTPLNILNFNFCTWEGRAPDDFIHFNWIRVNHDFFKTFNMKLIQGRAFSEAFSMDSIKYILNETALKFTELNDPLGKMFSIQNFRGQIIGIVKDFNSSSLHNEIKKVAFVLTPSFIHDYMFLKIKPGNIPGTIEYIKKTVTELAPGFPFEYRFLDDIYDDQYSSEKQTGTLLNYFSILAIFVSCLGLYGLVSFSAEQKTKEIGIRKVVGASVKSIIGMISKEYIKLVFLSSIIAFPFAYYIMNRWLQDYAYHTDLNVWVFLLSAGLAILITILTIWYQAYKAAVANPVDSLKYE